jgi:hypothetical protein
MYELFTDRARKVFQLANQEAQRFNHEYIGTEHILLGLIREGTGVAAKILEKLDVDLRRIRLEVERLVQSGPDMMAAGRLPETPRARHVIEYSMDESRKFGHGYVGTEHILLGLLREQEGVAGVVLANFGLEIASLRAKIVSTLSVRFDWGRKLYPPLPPARPVEERLSPIVEPPAVCPKCGQPQVVRVLWHWGHLCGKNQDDVAAGKAILGLQSYGQGPPWVCLHCQPKWSEVHRLALQDSELQAAKEKAIASQDFDLAAKHRDAQMELRGRMHSLIETLLRNQ